MILYPYSIGRCYWKPGYFNTLNTWTPGSSVFCCWLMWAIIYMAQMNPLVNPVLAGAD